MAGRLPECGGTLCVKVREKMEDAFFRGQATSIQHRQPAMSLEIQAYILLV